MFDQEEESERTKRFGRRSSGKLNLKNTINSHGKTKKDLSKITICYFLGGDDMFFSLETLSRLLKPHH